MPKYDYEDCPHNNVQDWTECCFDCGYNIYTSVEEAKRLKKAHPKWYGRSS